ncbi:hypothetical protein LJR039_004306 [Pseudorhodoferax sp. LjRoot39]|uniref:hypothetical protein n=1 Tax=Pseudorhodoferax sp. LjRoot39 TaxID=3342328 RepID=UPI003ECD9173
MTRGVELIRQRLAAGELPRQRETAELLGIDRVTLSRACQRAGLILPRGRPQKAGTD